MTTPVTERGRNGARPGGGVPGSRLPVPSRDRRPALAALALLLVVAGALGAALVVYRSGRRVDVLVAARGITPGERVSAADFTTARVSADGGATVAAASEANFVGSYALVGVPAGTLINNQMFQAAQVVPQDGVVVGVTVGGAQRPADPITGGSVVRAFLVPKQGSSAPDPGQAPTSLVLSPAARVVSTRVGVNNNDALTVSLLVPASQAGALVAASDDGAVALAVLAPGTKPEIDFRSGS